jgi:hypothetical protein
MKTKHIIYPESLSNRKMFLGSSDRLLFKLSSLVLNSDHTILIKLLCLKRKSLNFIQICLLLLKKQWLLQSMFLRCRIDRVNHRRSVLGRGARDGSGS